MKKLIKIIFTLMLSLAFVLPTLSDSEARIVETLTADISEDIIITVNGERVPFKAALVNGRAYLPVRVIGYALNSNVEWNGSTREILLETQKERVPYKEFSDLVSIDSGRIRAHRINNMYLHLNGNYNDSASKQIILIEERSYLPVRAISENLGIRSTWNEDTRTIEIVNPNTVEVADIDKPYYVYDLPEIETQEDYLVGNWRGHDSFTKNETGIHYKLDSAIYITRNSNGTYKQVARYTFNDSKNTEFNGKSFVLEYYDCEFDPNANTLMRNRNKCREISNELTFGILGADTPLYLDGEILSADYHNNGINARYQRF